MFFFFFFKVFLLILDYKLQKKEKSTVSNNFQTKTIYYTENIINTWNLQHEDYIMN